MKISSLISIIFLLPLLSSAKVSEPTDSGSVPKSVQATFASMYPDAFDVTWKKTTSFSADNVSYVYKVKFRQKFFDVGAVADSSGTHFAEYTHKAYIPEEAWKKFKTVLPNAEVTDCVESDSTDNVPHAYLDVSYSYGADSVIYNGTVYMDSAYTVLKEIREVPIAKLPKQVTEYVSKTMNGGTYEEGQGCGWMNEGGKESYFLTVNMKDDGKYYNLIFDAKGRLIKKDEHSYKGMGM
jgi:hypothetical protein